MNPALAARLAEACTAIAFCGALAIVVSYTDDEPRLLLTTAIAQPLASLATTYCPDRWDLFELRTAQKHCYEAGLTSCNYWHPEDERRFEACMVDAEAFCTVGNTQGGWAP